MLNRESKSAGDNTERSAHKNSKSDQLVHQTHTDATVHTDNKLKQLNKP